MKAAIKREQSQTGLSYAEREQSRRSQKWKNRTMHYEALARRKSTMNFQLPLTANR